MSAASGGKTQAPVLKDLGESLRLDYAQFLELELFTRFSTTLDARTQARIDHGRRTRAILTQPQYAPLTLALEAAELLALQEGLLDALPLDRGEAFKDQLPVWLSERCRDVLDRVERERRLEAADRNALREVIAALVEQLQTKAPAA